MKTRLAAHDADEAKEFFTRAVLIVSKDENLTKAHGRYLESRIIAAVRGAGRAKLVNGTEPPFKGLPEPEIADMDRVLDEIEILLPVLGLMCRGRLARRPGAESVRDRRCGRPCGHRSRRALHLYRGGHGCQGT